MTIPAFTPDEDTTLDPNTIRLTIEFARGYGMDQKKYGAIVPADNHEDWAKEVAKMVERTIRHHYGLDPIMEEQ